MEWFFKRFEELSAAELYEILRLRNEVFIVEQKCPYQDVDGNDRFARHLFAVDEQNTVCAYLRILEKNRTFDAASIGRVIVRMDQRGAGLAGQMVRRAIGLAESELGEHEIKIAAQAHLQNFYGGFGFIPCSGVYPEDGIPHMNMVYRGRKA